MKLIALAILTGALMTSSPDTCMASTLYRITDEPGVFHYGLVEIDVDEDSGTWQVPGTPARGTIDRPMGNLWRFLYGGDYFAAGSLHSDGTWSMNFLSGEITPNKYDLIPTGSVEGGNGVNESANGVNPFLLATVGAGSCPTTALPAEVASSAAPLPSRLGDDSITPCRPEPAGVERHAQARSALGRPRTDRGVRSGFARWSGSIWPTDRRF